MLQRDLTTLKNRLSRFFRMLTAALVAASIVVGCSTANKSSFPPDLPFMPPDISRWPINRQLIEQKDFESIDLFLNRAAQENPGQNVAWWTDYRKATLWTAKDKRISCTQFSNLAADPQFPLRRLAFLRAHENCDSLNETLRKLDPFSIETFDPWLTESALDITIAKAKAMKDPRALIDLHLRKSKFNLPREEKVEQTLASLKLAERLGLNARIHEIQKRLYQLSPSYNLKPDKTEWLAVANDFRYRRMFDEARSTYQKIIHHPRSTNNEKLQALRGIRMTYKVEQNREHYVQATRELAAFADKIFKKSKKTTSDYKFIADQKLILIRTLWTENHNKETYSELDKLDRLLEGKSSRAEIFWIRGRMEEEKSDFSKAIEYFAKALAEPQESPALNEKIRWYTAWNWIKLGRHKEAQEILVTLKEKTESSFDKSRFGYWLGRTYAALKEKDKAKKEFSELIAQDSLSYYGFLSYKELDLPLPIEKKQDDLNLEQISLSQKLKSLMDERYLEWLIAVQEIDVAKDYLDHVAKKLKEHNANDVDNWVKLFSYYAKSGNYLSMFTQLGTLEASVRRSVFENHPSLIFPKPFFETVSQTSARFGISVELIYAIMRQESSFNPQARSAMDAFGLMQILPSVALRTARENNIPMQDSNDLYLPHINIAAGTAHLRELWDKYSGEFVLAVASYNASETAIQNWLKTRFAGDTITFIEDIPYDETRDYVKLVMRNMVTYQILLTDSQKIHFPDWALKISFQEINAKNIAQ